MIPTADEVASPAPSRWLDFRRAISIAGALAAVSLAIGCGRGQTVAGGALSTSTSDAASVVKAATVAAPRTEQDEALWREAKTLEPDELARLAHREGPVGLVERGRESEWRPVALRALAYTDYTTNPWVALPWLAEIADGTASEDAQVAVETASALAARPRRAVDPEDAFELRNGCERLAAVAKNEQRAKPVRIGAMRTLRMLSEQGCVAPDAAH